MNKQIAMTCGNLALAPKEPPFELTVVYGGLAGETPVAAPAPACRPDTRPSISACTRNRAALLLAGICLFASLAVVLGSFALHVAGRSHAIEAARQQSVEVLPGDSLWSIASRHPIEGLATGDTVDAIRSWNKLDSSTLHAGMELIVPAPSQP